MASESRSFYEPYAFIGNGWVILPFPLYIVIVVFTLLWLFTRKTSIGLFIESVGVNARSSFFSGIDEKKIKLLAYTLCGLFAGMAGVLASANIKTSDANNIGWALELDAILAVVIGGTLMIRRPFLAAGQRHRRAGDAGDDDFHVCHWRSGERRSGRQGCGRYPCAPAVFGTSQKLAPKNHRAEEGGLTMKQKINAFISNNRRFIPVFATAVLFLIAYSVGAGFYQGMRDPQVFLNLFRTSPFLLIAAIGGTFVILTGGIDLSVSGVVALTTVAASALIRAGWDPWVVILLMLVMGMALGTILGSFITYMKVQPFIATLAGLWFARGMCFFISDDAIAVDNRVYKILSQTKILIPGLSDPVTKEGAYISLLVVVALVVLALAIYIAHYTRFGRTIYAIGGNEQSARLMGLPVNSTKVLVYTLGWILLGAGRPHPEHLCGFRAWPVRDRF